MHLTGRTRATLDEIANGIRHEGGVAHVATLDATDRDAVEAPAATVAEQAGGIDVCFNATSNDDIQGTPLLDMRIDDVMQPVAKAVTATLIVAKAAARHMHGRGVILVMGGGREAIRTSVAPTLPGPHSPVCAGTSPPSWGHAAFASLGCCHQAPPTRASLTRRPTACCSRGARATPRSRTRACSPPPTGPPR